MAIVAPKGRKHLSADALFTQVRSRFGTIPDDRRRDPETALTDALMAAFAMFSPQIAVAAGLRRHIRLPQSERSTRLAHAKETRDPGHYRAPGA